MIGLCFTRFFSSHNHRLYILFRWPFKIVSIPPWSFRQNLDYVKRYYRSWNFKFGAVVGQYETGDYILTKEVIMNNPIEERLNAKKAAIQADAISAQMAEAVSIPTAEEKTDEVTVTERYVQDPEMINGTPKLPM